MPLGSIQMQSESPVVLCFWDMNMSHSRAFCSGVLVLLPRSRTFVYCPPKTGEMRPFPH